MSESRQFLSQFNICQHGVHPAAFLEHFWDRKMALHRITLFCITLPSYFIQCWEHESWNCHIIVFTSLSQIGHRGINGWIAHQLLPAKHPEAHRGKHGSDKCYLLISELITLYFAAYLWPWLSQPSHLPTPNHSGLQYRIHLFPVSEIAITHFQPASSSEIQRWAVVFTSNTCSWTYQAPLHCTACWKCRRDKERRKNIPVIWRGLHHPLFLLLLLKLNGCLG